MRLTLAVPLLLAAAAFAAPASATSMYIPPVGACAGSLCPNGEQACVWTLCEDLTLTFSCTDLCQEAGAVVAEACDASEGACETVLDQVPGTTPVGACVGAWHCSYQGTACVQAGSVECRTVYAPATCTGSMCDSGTACVWGLEQDGSQRGGGVCLTPVCNSTLCNTVCNLTCNVVQSSVSLAQPVGTCTGSPTAYDPNAESCQGGIACVEQRPLSTINDFCLVFMTTAGLA